MCSSDDLHQRQRCFDQIARTPAELRPGALRRLHARYARLLLLAGLDTFLRESTLGLTYAAGGASADMDGFRLLEHVGLELDLPVISTPWLLALGHWQSSIECNSLCCYLTEAPAVPALLSLAVLCPVCQIQYRLHSNTLTSIRSMLKCACCTWLCSDVLKRRDQCCLAGSYTRGC